MGINWYFNGWMERIDIFLFIFNLALLFLEKSDKINWRTRIGYVGQKIALINGGVKENIILDKDYDKKKFHKIIKSCSLESFIKKRINDVNLKSNIAENISDSEESDSPKISIIGRPNAGKSTLINSLSLKERVIVSPLAGTTIDAINVPVEFGKKKI